MDSRPEDWKLPDLDRRVIVAVLVAPAVLLQAMPFLIGYRQSADDVYFLQVYLDGWDAVWRFTVDAAVEQGRLGQFIMLPLNTVGAAFQGIAWVRFLFVLLHFGIFAIFAFYVRALLGRPVGLVLFLVLVTMQPLAYQHLPPTAYPLQNSLPLLIILLVRLALMFRQRRGQGGARAIDIVLYTLFALAMAVTEFALLFGTALLAAEYLCRLAAAWQRSRSAAAALRQAVSNRGFLADCAAVFVVLAAYLIYRLAYPSQYPGNSPDGLFAFARFGETLLRHIWAGTIFAHLNESRAAAGTWVTMSSVLAGLFTAVAAGLTLSRAAGLRAPLLVAAVALLLALYVTAPLAATEKQQGWCVDTNVCAYLDSRISYLGVAAAIVAVTALLYRCLPFRPLRLLLTLGLSAGLGWMAAVANAQNWSVARDMAIDVATWGRAELLACHPELTPDDEVVLLRIIDPQSRVSFHPGFEPMDLWRKYMRHVAAGGGCPQDPAARSAASRRIAAFLPNLSPGETVAISRTSGGAFLGRGWSLPEAWGVWSDGKEAELTFFPEGLRAEQETTLSLRFHPYFGPSVERQAVIASVGGREVARFAIEREDFGEDCCRMDIPISPSDIEDRRVTVTLRIADPRDPAAEGGLDPRRLGIGLREFTLSAR